MDSALLEIVTFVVLVALFVWRSPSKADMDAGFRRVDERFAQQDAKIDALRSDMNERFAQQDAKIDALRSDMDERFAQQDAKMDAARRETKADIQRVEDRAAEANVFHARSVELLQAIHRELEGRERV